ncbi:hypothetical protein PFICI_10958 [Pestalotiopsis fici W106-1]|uniref:AB hydrolase-1 domain-containing protein n=1 Tax=Pestalotiopsis fici (strain W106-1 / CGMCC3.15140) TaxID=1229662 RepID=W3WTE5_PESFW|nr:uncharacterized protein PFICI_10958 [Pestalotiopsis fici W106-1]ETS77084.1 hypothetical protein PFICI_10958 [Pestalotiopsis fici W106-1]
MAQDLRAYAPAWLQAIQQRASFLRQRCFDYISLLGSSLPILSTRRPDTDPDAHILQQRHPLLHANAESSEEYLVLSDGRKVGVAYYGAQSGPVVFYLHGFPGSRLSGTFFDTPGKKLGARIIAVDRPGIGNSSPQPGRTIFNHANDVREIAELLGVESYGIIGVSGGGPYALACAYLLPKENLKAVSILAGMGPIDIGTRGMNWSNWFIFNGFMYFPFIIRWIQNKLVATLATVSNEKIVALVERQLSKPSNRQFMYTATDIAILRDPDFLSMMLNFYREHYKQGVDGHMEDGRVLTTNLGFRLQDIRPSLPIQMWYSKDDTNVPFRMARAMAERLSCPPQFHAISDETHLSLVLKYSADVLEHLLEKL